MKKVAIIIIFCVNQVFGQNIIESKIIDAETELPLEHVSVYLKNGLGGTLTNANGEFQLSLGSTKDSISFSYIGYEEKIIAIDSLTSVIALYPQNLEFEEVAVNGKIGQIFLKCYDKIEANKEVEYYAKGFYRQSTEINNKEGVELLEAFFESKFEGLQLALIYLPFNARQVKDWCRFLEVKNMFSQNFLYVPWTKEYAILKAIIAEDFSENYTGRILATQEGCHIIEVQPKEVGYIRSARVWITASGFSLKKLELTFEYPDQKYVDGSSSKDQKMSVRMIFDEYVNRLLSIDARLTCQFWDSDGNEPVQQVTKSELRFYEFPYLIPHRLAYRRAWLNLDENLLKYSRYNRKFWERNDYLKSNPTDENALKLFNTRGNMIDYGK